MTVRSAKARERQFLLQSAAVLFFIFVCIFMLLARPAAAQRGVRAGLALCLQTLIPSMLPLLILGAFFQRSAAGDLLRRFSERPTRLLFGVCGAGASALLFGVLGGFPASADAIRTGVEQRVFSRRDAQVLQLLAFYPSAAFVIGAVGTGMLGSLQAGALLEASVLLPVPLLSFPLRFWRRSALPAQKRTEPPLALAQAFLTAVEEGTQTMLRVCAFVCLFSALPPLLDAPFLCESLRVWLLALPELTAGVRLASQALPLPCLAALLSFGGFCAHCQVLPTLRAVRLRYGVFLLFRLCHALLSALVCGALCRLFPVETAVFAQQGAAFAPSAASSVSVSVCLCCMCALLLVGGETVLCRPKKKKEPL